MPLLPERPHNRRRRAVTGGTPQRHRIALLCLGHQMRLELLNLRPGRASQAGRQQQEHAEQRAPPHGWCAVLQV